MKKETIIIVVGLTLLFGALVLGYYLSPLPKIIFGNRSELGGIEEVENIYHPDQTFHDYYLLYEERKNKGENETAFIIIFQDHIQELITPEVQDFADQYFEAIGNSDKDLFNSLVEEDGKTTHILSIEMDQARFDEEKNLMFHHYLIDFLENNSDKLCDSDAKCLGEKTFEEAELKMWEHFKNKE